MGRSILAIQPFGVGARGEMEGRARKKRARTKRHRGTTRDTRRNTAVHRWRVDARRKKELVTFPRFTTGWIAPIDHPLPFFFFFFFSLRPSVNEPATNEQHPTSLVKDTPVVDSCKLTHRCRETSFTSLQER